jgi:hypothetical protein
MDWLDRFAEWLSHKLKSSEVTLVLSLDQIRRLAGVDWVPQACYWWSSLEPYLAFATRGVEAEPRVVDMRVKAVVFRRKRYAIDRTGSSRREALPESRMRWSIHQAK